MTQGSASRPDASRLHQWIARASFPEERLRCKAFAFSAQQDDVILKSRREQWHGLFSDASAKDGILKRRGISEAQWHRSMRDVEVSEPAHLPDWAKVFIELHDHWRRQGEWVEANHLAEKPQLGLTAAWAQMCRPWLDAQQAELATAQVRLTEPSVDDLLENLMMRLAVPLFGVLRVYPSVFSDLKRINREKPYLTLTFWQDAFDRQPILVKIIGNLVLCWRVATQEMLQRFAADLPRLAEHAFLREKARDDEVLILKLPCGLGDPHRGGRSVSIFETNFGDVVYKPKDLIGTSATGRLLHDLHSAHNEFVPLPPEFLYCDGYGWEQRVRQRECSRIEEVETFYRRLGGWLFLVQLLNGNDFWYDNLIACADMPYFIDYETIVGNGFFDHWNLPDENEHIEQFKNMQVIGILPLLMPGSMTGALTDSIDISTAAPPGKQRTPFESFKPRDAANVDGTAGGGVYDDFQVSDHAPFLRGEFQDMNDFLEDFIDGYRRMGALFKTKIGRDALQRFHQQIDRARFRQIIVDTWQCYSLLYKFFSNCGHDGVRATTALDGFLEMYNKYPRAVAEGIRHDIWNNDVPLFELQTNSLEVFNTADAGTGNPFFKKTAFDRIKRNEVYLRTELERQVEHIGALFASRPDWPRRSWRRCAQESPPQSATDRDLLELAQEAGDQLAALINQPERLRDRLAMGRYQLSRDFIPQIFPLGLDGCSGMIVFLATLQRHGAERDDHMRALKKCHQYLVGASHDSHEATRIERYYAQQETKHCGVLSAPGAKLVALCRLARLESAVGGNPAADIESLMHVVLKGMQKLDTLPMDFRHGVGGLLHRFQELESVFDDATLTDWMEQALALVEDKAVQASPEQTDAYRVYADALLPDAAAGMALVDQYMQARWPGLAAHPGYLKLQRAIASESDNAPDDADAYYNLADSAENLLVERTETLMDCLYWLLAERGDAQSARDRVLDEIVQRRRDSKRWFPDSWADDKFLLGAVHGQADMGLLLLSARARENLNPFRLTA